MESLKYIFRRPEHVEGLGEIHPIKLKDYDEFVQYATVLQVSKKTMKLDEDDSVSNFDLLLGCIAQDESILYFVTGLLNLVTGKHFHFSTEENRVVFTDTDYSVKLSYDNYDAFRDTVMKQNLIFEKKVYKNPAVQKWADKVMEARSKNSIKVTTEDMITTVHAITGTSFEVIENYTIYQLKAVFERVSKVKDYDTSIQARLAGNDKTDVQPYMAELNMFKNPYDDLFVDKGKKLSKFNQAFGELQ